jgi:hypothetical protein
MASLGNEPLSKILDRVNPSAQSRVTVKPALEYPIGQLDRARPVPAASNFDVSVVATHRSRSGVVRHTAAAPADSAVSAHTSAAEAYRDAVAKIEQIRNTRARSSDAIKRYRHNAGSTTEASARADSHLSRAATHTDHSAAARTMRTSESAQSSPDSARNVGGARGLSTSTTAASNVASRLAQMRSKAYESPAYSGNKKASPLSSPESPQQDSYSHIYAHVSNTSTGVDSSVPAAAYGGKYGQRK